ncbi:tail fiber domain-containing protein [Paraburkholderia sp. MM5477-R1]|uniref:tail fiber domain-containing protein n=1 Tax=Paraburkholderia sp. MM5477-R1 TaxID=2991062 RepID=UPI003D214AD0
MSDTLPQRPTFSNGQYIGADDLNAAVTYDRDKTARQALSGRTWGIASGLALVEITDATGATQMYIEPGIAWDGYGRPIVVISPAPVTLDLFAGLPPGNQPVWLKYSALDTQRISPGFQTCGTGDPVTRIADSYAIVTGAQNVTQQTGGVVLNGVTVADPRDMLIAFDAAAAVVLDGSAPHQLFPDDSAAWLVPVGIVSYVAGSPGSFNPRTEAQLALSRVARRYANCVAESVLAADGVLRLRDRQTDQQSGLTDDDLAAKNSIQASDVQSDPNNATRLVGNELVWVEGNMRVLGDARLWGGMLSLRVADGTEPAGSLFLRRNADTTTPTVQNLEVSIGQAPAGGLVNRLLVAASQPATANTPATLLAPPALSVGTDSRVGIGVAVPGAGLTLDVNGDFGHDGDPTTLHLNGCTIGGENDGSLLLTARDGTIELGPDIELNPGSGLTHVGIGTASPQPDTALDVRGGGIAVNTGNAFLRLLGSALIDQGDGTLRIRSGGNIVTFDGNDNVGIGTTNPVRLLDVNGDANVAGSLNLGGGITITNTGAAFVQMLGSKVFDDNNGKLHLQSGGSIVAFDGPNNDNVGIGTATPAARLDVNGNTVVRGDATVTGSMTVGGVFYPSDARLKRDIAPLGDALGKLLALRGVEFEWAREDLAQLRPGRQTGLIADEVEAVFPGWVRQDPSSDTKLLTLQGFEAVVIEALRQLTERVEALEDENARLSRMLEACGGGTAAPSPPSGGA